MLFLYWMGWSICDPSEPILSLVGLMQSDVQPMNLFSECGARLSNPFLLAPAPYLYCPIMLRNIYTIRGKNVEESVHTHFQVA